MDKQKVLIFNPKITAGGISKILSDYMSHFTSFVDVEMMTLEIADDIYIKNQNIKTHVIGTSKNIFKRIKREYRILKNNQYDVIHINGDYISRIIECIVAKACGIRKIIIHSHNDGVGSNKWYKVFLNHLLKKIFDFFATDYLACSKSAAEWLFSRKIVKNKKYEIIPNGIDVEKFKFQENIRKKIREQYQLKNQLVIGFVGRISYQKNPLFLLDILKECKKIRKDIQLMVIGTGNLEEEMKEKIKDDHLEENVIMVGVVSDVYHYYNAMDVFLLPSKYEGLGIVNIESQASGLPTIVSTNVPMEAKVSNLIQYISLEKPASYWAEQIMKSKRVERKNAYQEVINHQYDIKSATQKLEKIYFHK